MRRASPLRKPDHGEAFFKIVLDVDEGTKGVRVMAFVMPNKENVPGDLVSYTTSVDHVEELTGLDFFHELEDTVEDEIEREIPRALWPVN